MGGRSECLARSYRQPRCASPTPTGGRKGRTLVTTPYPCCQPPHRPSRVRPHVSPPLCPALPSNASGLAPPKANSVGDSALISTASRRPAAALGAQTGARPRSDPFAICGRPPPIPLRATHARMKPVMRAALLALLALVCAQVRAREGSLGGRARCRTQMAGRAVAAAPRQRPGGEAGSCWRGRKLGIS